MLGDVLSRFEFADPGRKERRAYTRSLKFLGGDRSKMLLHPAGMDMIQVIDFMRDVAYEKNRRTVGILLDAYATAGKNFACYLKILLTRARDVAGQQSTNFYVWTSQDADAKENILTFAYPAFYKSSYLKKVHKRMLWILAMGLENMWRRFINVFPVDEKMTSREGDLFRSCRADNYRENMPHVDCAPFGPVQFKALAITCGVLLALSVLAIVREMCKRKPKHPKLRHNKVAATQSSRVADREDQSEQSARDDTPSGRVITAIEVIQQEEVKNAFNANSRAEVAPSMELFNKRANLQVELPLNTTAVRQQVQSVRSRWNIASLRQKEAGAIEVVGDNLSPKKEDKNS